MDVSRETSSPPTASHPPRLAALAQWLAASAAPLGLTGYVTADQLLREAMLPALAITDVLQAPPTGTWADIGAGSGALGLTLALTFPELSVHLVDRRDRVIAFLDVTARRFALPNVIATRMDLSLDACGPYWDHVGFRALAAPQTALALAAAHSRAHVCAWHSVGLQAYGAPPSGFSLCATVPACARGLVLTLYHRSPEHPAPPSGSH